MVRVGSGGANKDKAKEPFSFPGCRDLERVNIQTVEAMEVVCWMKRG